MSDETVVREPWEVLQDLVTKGDATGLASFLHGLAPEETAYTFAQLDDEVRTRMFEILSDGDPDLAADLLEHVVDDEAARMLEDLEPGDAAAIVDEMDSDEQADVLVHLDPEDAEAILDLMEPDEAADASRLLQYPPDSAGGLMITEYLAFYADQHAADVVEDLRAHGDAYRGYEVRYLYVVDRAERLVGVVPLRRLVMSARERLLDEVKSEQPLCVRVEATLSELEDLFDRVDLSAIPVVDPAGVLVGVIQRSAVQEALRETATAALLKFGGIIGGEELRSMPVWQRQMRRLAFLLPNILLSYLAVSIIAAFEPLIHRLTALAIFIPMVANLSGAAGNQSVAVSIRELSLGVVRGDDVLRVWRREWAIGLLNGLVIGAILAVLAYVTRPDTPVLAVAVGGAYALNSVFAVVLGSALPLLLTRLSVDPAMLSNPILSTLTDMGAFSLTLVMAAAYLHAAA